MKYVVKGCDCKMPGWCPHLELEMDAQSFALAKMLTGQGQSFRTGLVNKKFIANKKCNCGRHKMNGKSTL